MLILFLLDNSTNELEAGEKYFLQLIPSAEYGGGFGFDILFINWK